MTSTDDNRTMHTGRSHRGASSTRRTELTAELDELLAEYERFPTSHKQVRIAALRDWIDRIDARVHGHRRKGLRA